MSDDTYRSPRDNRARFRELLEQNGGTVTPEMKALRAEYLEQQETASDLAGLIAEKKSTYLLWPTPPDAKPMPTCSATRA